MSWFTSSAGDDQDRPVGAHGERGAERLLRLLHPDRDRDDLLGDALLLQPDRLLDGDLVGGSLPAPPAFTVSFGRRRMLPWR